MFNKPKIEDSPEPILDKQRLVETLFQIECIQVSDVQPFKVSHNSLAPIKIESKEIISFPAKRDEIVQMLIATLKKEFDNDFAYIGGVSPVGIPFTYLIANKLKLPMIYVRDQEINSLDGRYTVEGVVKDKDKVILLTNEIRTGTRIIETIKILEKRGAKVIGCISLIDYNVNGTKKKFEDINMKVVSLLDLKDIIEIGKRIGRINERQAKQIHDWSTDIYSWIEAEKKKLAERTKEVKDKVIDIFIKLGLIEVRLSNPLKFWNIYSPIFIDTKKLLSYPAEREFIYKSMIDLNKEKLHLEKVDVVAGEAASGIAPAAWLADYLKKPLIYVRDDREDIEGKISKNDHVLLLDDVLGTGEGTLNAVGNIAKLGGVVKNMLTIVDYGFSHTKQMLGYENISLFSVLTLAELLEACAKAGSITDEEKKEVLDWIHDPYEWSKHLRNTHLEKFV